MPTFGEICCLYPQGKRTSLIVVTNRPTHRASRSRRHYPQEVGWRQLEMLLFSHFLWTVARGYVPSANDSNSFYIFISIRNYYKSSDIKNKDHLVINLKYYCKAVFVLKTNKFIFIN
jgi:hypothetical protein